MSRLLPLAEIAPIQVCDGVCARCVQVERLAVAASSSP